MLRIGAIILVGLFCQADAVIKCHTAFTDGAGTTLTACANVNDLTCWRADSTYVLLFK